MLNAVLTKLIECADARNQYVLRGHLDAANHCISKFDILVECLEAAGHKPKITTANAEIVDGLFKGCRGNLITGISFAVPGISSDDVNAFKAVGFEWLWASNIMKYEFKLNRKGKAC